MIEPILLGLSQVADLDEGDVVEVALVVDVLQLLEDVLVLLVGLVVCSDATKVNLSPSNEHNASNFQLPTSNFQLTEEGGQTGHLGHQHVEHLVSDILDLIAAQLMREPIQDALLVLQITCLTSNSH